MNIIAMTFDDYLAHLLAQQVRDPQAVLWPQSDWKTMAGAALVDELATYHGIPVYVLGDHRRVGEERAPTPGEMIEALPFTLVNVLFFAMNTMDQAKAMAGYSASGALARAIGVAPLYHIPRLALTFARWAPDLEVIWRAAPYTALAESRTREIAKITEYSEKGDCLPLPTSAP